MREGLFRLASKPELERTDSRCRNGTSFRVDRWQGQEQASLLLLLGCTGTHSGFAADGGIARIAAGRSHGRVGLGASKSIGDPRTIAAIIDKAHRQTIARKVLGSNSLDQQVAHLFEACGRMRAKQAIPLMNEYIPNLAIMGERSRSAAIWALGMMHQGNG